MPNISEATVVTLYLLPSLNTKLLPKLNKELKPGTRIVSHNFEMRGRGRVRVSARGEAESGREHDLPLDDSDRQEVGLTN